jgi:transcriptional regulatory protein LEU3
LSQLNYLVLLAYRNSFNRHYLPHVEGLFDEELSPDQLYRQSPLLFWSIVCTGARRYAKDPRLYAKLIQPVIDLTFAAFARPLQPTPIIQSAIILCNWPIPFDLMHKDPSKALAGAAMSLAIQYGFHLYCKEQDFVNRSTVKDAHHPKTVPSGLPSRKSRLFTDATVAFRSRLWCRAVVTFQSTHFADGLSPPLCPSFMDSETFDESQLVLPFSLSYRLRTHKIQTDAIEFALKAHDPGAETDERDLHQQLDVFEERLRSIELPDQSPLGISLSASQYLKPLTQ